MEESKEKARQTPKEELMQSALDHYEQASSAIHHYSSDIPKAIKAYYSPDSQTKELRDENERLKGELPEAAYSYEDAYKKLKKQITQLQSDLDTARKNYSDKVGLLAEQNDLIADLQSEKKELVKALEEAIEHLFFHNAQSMAANKFKELLNNTKKQ